MSAKDSRGVQIATGDVAHDAVDAGNPIKIGAKSASPAAITEGDRADLIVDPLNNALQVQITGAGGLSRIDGQTLAADGSSPNATAMITKAAPAEFNGTTYDRIRHSFTQNTDGITTSAAGTALDLTTTPMSKHALQVFKTAGGSAFVVVLEGTLDGTRWFVLVAHTNVSGDIVFAIDKPVLQVRYNVTTIGAGNTLDIDILSCPR